MNFWSKCYDLSERGIHKRAVSIQNPRVAQTWLCPSARNTPVFLQLLLGFTTHQLGLECLLERDDGSYSPPTLKGPHTSQPSTHLNYTGAPTCSGHGGGFFSSRSRQPLMRDSARLFQLSRFAGLFPFRRHACMGRAQDTESCLFTTGSYLASKQPA